MNAKEQSLPEITIKAVILGVVLAVVLGAANAYLGLFAGMTVSASIPAAVVSMGVLRLFRKSNILENNMVQTIASSGEALTAGVIFTIPALVILDYWKEFNPTWVIVIGSFGGFLGVLFTIPLRRAFIVEDKLQYPEGIATAEVLKAGEGTGSEVKHIIKAALAGGLFKFAAEGLQIWKGIFEVAGRVKGTIAYFGSNLSPALLSVGYILGLNISVLIFMGGACNWLIAIPICAACRDWPIVDGQALPAVDWARQIWSQQTRYIGVGAMLVGGLWTIVNLRSSLLRGISSGLKAYRKIPGQQVELARTEKDVPMKWVLVLIAGSVVPLFILYQTFVAKVSVSLPMAVIMLITGFLFSAVAGYMAGLVGSSNNPISGVTIATVVVSGFLLSLLMGSGAENGPPAAIIIGSVVCCAAAMAGDTMQDLKAGYIVGSTPWKQQLMEVAGSLPAALLMAPILTLLYKAYGFAGHASAKANALAAPQANLIASIAKGVFKGQLPWEFILIGVVFAVGVIILDEYLRSRASSFRTPVLAIAIGIYLPFELAVPIFAGGIIHQIVKVYHKRKNTAENVVEESNRRGILFASGLITGEALVGIVLAIPIVLSGNPRVLAIFERPLLGPYPGIVLLAGIACWLCLTVLIKTDVEGRKGH
jgi:putative OPT family oligopeptide transporter